jgi:hypothetical protein
MGLPPTFVYATTGGGGGPADYISDPDKTSQDYPATSFTAVGRPGISSWRRQRPQSRTG